MHTLRVYILKRLLQSIPLILFVMAINFVIIHAAPGDPITYLYGSSAEVSAEQMQKLREELGLTQPLYIQYVLYLRQLLRERRYAEFARELDVTLVPLRIG